MLNVLSVDEVKQAEARAEKSGLNEDILIENASAAVVRRVLRIAKKSEKICVLAGGGNNGADGLSVARMLFLAGRKVELMLASDNFGAAASARLKACRLLGVKEISVDKFRPDDFGIVIDAIFGTGCNRPLGGVARVLAEKCNASAARVVAVDIPSGLNADTGETELAVKAFETVTFSFAKLGHFMGKGRNYVGKLTVADIGLRGEGSAKALEEGDAEFPAREPVSHKYDYGRVRVIAGSPEMLGASLLAHESAVSALKCGAGLVSLCVPSSLRTAYQARVKEETLCFLPDMDGKIIFDSESLQPLFEKTKAILIGPGMGKNAELIKIIEYIKDNFSGALILDADALNAVAGNTEILRNRKSDLILTPHMGEFARLTAGMFDESEPVISRVKKFAAKIGAVVVAKSATTVISDGNTVYLNATGTPALAKGGSGDVLGGMIAALACRMSPLEAALRGCYVFGKCAEKAEKTTGTESLLASDIIPYFKEI